MLIDIDKLPLEERDLITQFGKISRPFSKELNAQPVLYRIAAAYYALTAAAKTWEVVGFDISYWQKGFDFDILQELANFIIIRYGYGNDWFDPEAVAFVRECVDRNIAYSGYWYVKPGKDFTKHANSFYEARKAYGGSLYPMFDLEETGGLGKTALESWYQKMYTAFCNKTGLELEDLMTYTSAGFLNSAIGLTSWLKHTNLDVAHWTTAPDPLLPNEWKTPGKTWKKWQHAIIKVDGKSIDAQRYNGTRADFNAEFDEDLPPMPEPPPPPVPEYITVNIPLLNLRVLPSDDASTYIAGTTTLNKRLKTTGIQYKDAKDRGYWYQIADDHGQVLWVAGWLCRVV